MKVPADCLLDARFEKARLQPRRSGNGMQAALAAEGDRRVES
jgi:hypothetical protein